MKINDYAILPVFLKVWSSIDPRCEIIILGGQWEKVVTSGINNTFGGSQTAHEQESRQTVVFTGTYQRTLDGKLRVLIPKRLRSESPGLGLGTGTHLFLTPGTDRCLELHTTESLNELAQRANQSPAGSRSIRSFSRLFYARAEQCDVDKQGRIRIPNELARLAELSKEVVFIGVGFHWELWNLEFWELYLREIDGAFDQISEATFDGPLGSAVFQTAGQTPQQDNQEKIPAQKTNSVQQKSKPK